MNLRLPGAMSGAQVVSCIATSLPTIHRGNPWHYVRGQTRLMYGMMYDERVLPIKQHSLVTLEECRRPLLLEESTT